MKGNYKTKVKKQQFAGEVWKGLITVLQNKVVASPSFSREQSSCTNKQVLTLVNEDSDCEKKNPQQRKTKTQNQKQSKQTLKQIPNSIILTRNGERFPLSFSRHFCTTSGQAITYTPNDNPKTGTKAARKKES